MAADKAQFVVDLQDQVSGPAESAASSLERLKAKIQADSQALRDMQSAMGKLKGGTADVTAQKKILGDRITATKTSMGQAQASYLKAGGSLSELSKKTKVAGAETSNTGSLMEAAGLSAEALAAAGVAVAAAIVAAAGALTLYALGAADAARSSRLLMTAWGGSAAAGAAMSKEVQYLSRRLPLAREDIAKMAQELSGKGLKGGALLSSISAIGTATAVLGSGAGAKLQAIAEQAAKTKRVVIGMFDLQGSGVSLDEVATTLSKQMNIGFGAAKAALQNGSVKLESGMKALDATVQAKFGKLAEEQFLSLPNQLKKVQESFGDIFSGLDIEPVLKALHEVLSIFDANTQSGKALKLLAETIFKPLIGEAPKAGHAVASAMKTAIIWGLQVAQAYYQVKIALKNAIPPGLRPNLNALGQAMSLVAAAAMMVGAAFVTVGALAALPIVAFLALQAASQAVGKWLTTLDWGAIGLALVQGFVNGMLLGLPMIASAAAKLGASGLKALRGAIDSHSPSRLAHKIGLDFGAGYAGGQDASTQDVAAAAAGLGGASVGALASSGGGGAGGGGSKSITVGNVYVTGVNADGSNLRAQMISALEAMLGSGGLSPEGA